MLVMPLREPERALPDTALTYLPVAVSVEDPLVIADEPVTEFLEGPVELLGGAVAEVAAVGDPVADRVAPLDDGTTQGHCVLGRALVGGIHRDRNGYCSDCMNISGMSAWDITRIGWLVASHERRRKSNTCMI